MWVGHNVEGLNKPKGRVRKISLSLSECLQARIAPSSVFGLIQNGIYTSAFLVLRPLGLD